MSVSSRAAMASALHAHSTWDKPMSTQHPDNYAYGQIMDQTDIRTYLLAGNSTFTIVSKATGRRFTYRVKSAPKDRNLNWSTNNQNRDFFFVSVLTGGDNDASYTYLGTLSRNSHDNHDSKFTYKHGHKSTIKPDALSNKGFAWFVATLESHKDLSSLEFWHEGKCGRCGRKLTVPSSIESGMGPECAGKED